MTSVTPESAAMTVGETPVRRQGFLRCLEIEAEDAPNHPQAFDRVRAGELHALVVHGVYRPEVLAPVVERLERHDPPFVQTWFPDKFRAWFYGCNLNLTEPPLSRYFTEAGRFHAQLTDLFPQGLGLVERVGAVLAALDGGRPFIAAPGPGDEHYMFTTLRAHLEGGYLPAHFDNEQALRPSYEHLRRQVELHMTSFVLTLQAADEGGELEVFDHTCDPASAVPISYDGAAKPDLSRLPSTAFRIPAGSLIVLDSGRYLHRVLPTRGARKRWTACSFMALSRQRDATCCWG